MELFTVEIPIDCDEEPARKGSPFFFLLLSKVVLMSRSMVSPYSVPSPGTALHILGCVCECVRC